MFCLRNRCFRLFSFLFLFFFCLTFFNNNAIAISPRASLQQIEDKKMQRVIVIFKGEINLDLIKKYGGEIIRTSDFTKNVICIMPPKYIKFLRLEEAVINVAIDKIVIAEVGDRKRDPKELSEFECLKREYLRRIREEYWASIRAVYDEYRNAMQDYFKERRRCLMAYVRIMQYLRDRYGPNSKTYKFMAKRYYKMLKEYYQGFARLREEYIEKIREPRNTYGSALSNWREHVNEMVIMAFNGPAQVKWNNQESGINSEAAWTRYNVDGTGIKVAILDTGINYHMENLDDGYLGGYDYVDADTAPEAANVNEYHGTEVASILLGEGVNKVVGVAYNASYYALRVLQTGPPGPIGEWWGWVSDFEDATYWASDPAHKADIISMSIGAYNVEPGTRDLWITACDNAYNNEDILLIAGSGNNGYTYSADPAAFTNVISVGAHREDQSIPTWSNEGVDCLAPGSGVYTVDPQNQGWLDSGTSMATPHVSGLAALMLQYARQNNLEVNNGYLWEGIKHSAIDMGGTPAKQGKGKAWAADTAPVPPDPGDGAVDLIAGRWPLSYDITYSNEVYWYTATTTMFGPISVPAYYIGTNMYEDIALTNVTATLGNYTSDVENLTVNALQQYFEHMGEVDLPGSPLTTDTAIPITSDNIPPYSLAVSYYQPWTIQPGLNRTNLSLDFNFVGDTRQITFADPYASIWCPPEALNEDFVDLSLEALITNP